SSAAKATLPDLFAVTDALVRGGLTSVPHLSIALSAGPASVDAPAPSSKPRFVYGGRDDYRWQFGLSLAWGHFNSFAFSANAIGIKTSVSYFLNQWLGVEGNVTAAFSPTTLGTDHVKIALYGGGPKVAWRQKRWEPWLHGIFGGAHVLPQTAAGSRSTYSIMAGGGAGYPRDPPPPFPAEGGYLGTALFPQNPKNLQLAGGAVLHF